VGLELLALAGVEEDRVRTGEAATDLSVEAVEAAGLTTVPFTQIAREACIRCVEVEESSR
jgi:hypothetical protein